MTKEVGPTWTEGEQSEANRIRDAWESFFSQGEGAKEKHVLAAEEQNRIADVLARHEAALLRYANVVAVGPSIRVREGKPTGEPCIAVYVKRKLPRIELSAEEALPDQLEGVPIDVVEVGEIGILPS